jgi:hypothetical protein
MHTHACVHTTTAHTLAPAYAHARVHARTCALTPTVTHARRYSRRLRDYSREIEGKQQLLIAGFAKALEVIPRQLCDNAGFDATNILNKLRQKHATGAGYGCNLPPIIISMFICSFCGP